MMPPRNQNHRTATTNSRSSLSSGRLILLLLFGLSLLLHIRLYSFHLQAERQRKWFSSSSSSSSTTNSIIINNTLPNQAANGPTCVNGTINSLLVGQGEPSIKVDDTIASSSTTTTMTTRIGDKIHSNDLLDQHGNASLTLLPEPWMQDYILWHQEKTQSFRDKNNDNYYDWSQHRYLIVRCLHQDVSCGGLADRLRSLPFLLLVAAKSKRLLFFYWERPAPIETFFEPVTMDWRLPSPLLQRLLVSMTTHGQQKTNKTWQFPRHVRGNKISDVERWLLQSTNIVEDFRSQAYSEAAKYYETATRTTSTTSTRQSSSFTLMDEHMGPLWRVMFRPIPHIRQAIKNEWDRHDLVPGEYIAVHSRTLYTSDLSTKQSVFTSLIENSIHCAKTLLPTFLPQPQQQNDGNDTISITATKNVTGSNKKIWFASDSRQAKDHAVQYGQGQVVTTALIRQRPSETASDDNDDHEQEVHFDRGAAFLIPNNKRTTTITTTSLMNQSRRQLQQPTAAAATTASTMEAYYSVIQDLYLLASGRCVGYDRGGFGKLAALLSIDPTCSFNHRKKTCPKKRAVIT